MRRIVLKAVCEDCHRQTDWSKVTQTEIIGPDRWVDGRLVCLNREECEERQQAYRVAAVRER